MIILYNILSYSLLSILTNVDYIVRPSYVAQNNSVDANMTTADMNSENNDEAISNKKEEFDITAQPQPLNNRRKLKELTGTEVYLWQLENEDKQKSKDVENTAEQPRKRKLFSLENPVDTIINIIGVAILYYTAATLLKYRDKRREEKERQKNARRS